jgi:hypothetical protein
MSWGQVWTRQKHGWPAQVGVPAATSGGGGGVAGGDPLPGPGRLQAGKQLPRPALRPRAQARPSSALDSDRISTGFNTGLVLRNICTVHGPLFRDETRLAYQYHSESTQHSLHRPSHIVIPLFFIVLSPFSIILFFHPLIFYFNLSANNPYFFARGTVYFNQ